PPSPDAALGCPGDGSGGHALGEILELVLESGGHHAERAVGAGERPLAGGVEQVVLATAAAALRRWRADVRHHHLLGFEAIERNEDGGGWDFVGLALPIFAL